MTDLRRDIFQGERLSVEEFNRCFDEQWELMARRFFKYEGLQWYDEGADGPIAQYLQGDVPEFVRRLRQARSEDQSFFDTASERGVEFYRIHAMKQPFTRYMEAEFYSYLLSERMGEQIYYIPEEKVLKLAGGALPDFILFDTSLLLVLDYNSSGVLQGAWRVSAPMALEFVNDLATQLLEHGVPFKECFDSRPEIEAMLK